MTRLFVACRGLAGLGLARPGSAGHGPASLGMAGLGRARCGMSWSPREGRTSCGHATWLAFTGQGCRRGVARHGTVRPGTVGRAMASPGKVGQVEARPGKSRQGDIGPHEGRTSWGHDPQIGVSVDSIPESTQTHEVIR
jgi:hypothetical protein